MSFWRRLRNICRGESTDCLVKQQTNKISAIFRNSKGSTSMKRIKSLLSRGVLKETAAGKLRVIYEWSSKKGGDGMEIAVFPNMLVGAVYFFIRTGGRAQIVSGDLEDLFEDDSHFQDNLKDAVANFIEEQEKAS